MASLPLWKCRETYFFQTEDDPLFEKGINWGFVTVAKTVADVDMTLVYVFLCSDFSVILSFSFFILFPPLLCPWILLSSFPSHLLRYLFFIFPLSLITFLLSPFSLIYPSLFWTPHVHLRVPGLTNSSSSPLPPAPAPAPAPNPEPSTHSWVTAAGDGSRLSSDEEDAETPEDTDRPAFHCSNRHPQPLGVNIITANAAVTKISKWGRIPSFYHTLLLLCAIKVIHFCQSYFVL